MRAFLQVIFYILKDIFYNIDTNIIRHQGGKY
jgi:hypothetical protein